MARGSPALQSCLKTYFFLLLGALSAGAAPEQGSLYMWIDANQARILIGFEEDILIVSEGQMAPFTHDFKKAQQRMPAIPVHIHHVNFTWQVTDDQAEYFYEFQSLRSFDKEIMDDPIVNVPLLGSVPHKASALCSPRCQNGGLCMSPGVCICPPGYFGAGCEKANCSTTCLNGGTCFHPGKCICPAAFEGSRCEISKCRQPCRNGGKCMGRNKCKCSKGYHGDLCSKAVCEPSCGAHGTCIEPNRCHCRDGWHGRHCNKRYRGGFPFIHRPTISRPKTQAPSAKETKEASDNNQPSETNYVV
uniref:Wnt inhibitory factor 1 n=1 Tax=Astyanax mexicanus TaxID=7994 RepID=W5KVI9_ASTMX